MMRTRYKNILPRYTEGVPAEASWYDYAADLLDKFEGFREEVYLDGKNIPTIGYGFTDPKLIGRGRISKPEAKKILKNEISTRGDSLRNILGAERFDKLADSTKAALLSYYYNYPAGFKDSTKMMTAWRNNDYNEFVRQIDAGMNDAANPGLKDRRLEEQGIIKEDPFLFPKEYKPLFLTAAQYHAQNQFKPKYLNTAGTDFSMYNTAPSSVRAVGGVSGPSFTKSLYQTNRAVEAVDGMLLNNIKKINTDQSLMFNSNNKILGLPNMRNGKLPRYQTGNIPITTTGGAPVVVPVTTVPDDTEANDVKKTLERVAGFLPYVGTIQDWQAVAEGNYNKIPSAIVGTVADAFLPGLKSAYKAYKSYNILSKTAPKIVDKIVYGKKAAKAGQKLSANGAYQAVGTYQDVLDDQGYMSKHKNGKLPLFENGTSGVLMVLHPISSIRKRLYDHVFPYGYNNAAERAFSALAKNKPHISENYGKWNYRGNEQRLDDLWGTYLQIPDSQRHYPRVLTKSKYSPTISKDDNDVYYSVPLSNEEKHHIVNHALWYGNDKDAPKLLNPDFGNFTVGRGRDSNGDYASWYDTWDLNPARGISNIGGNIAKKLGLDKIEDLSLGIGKPFSLYDRIYLDDYYGVKGNNRGGIYLPEITVQGRNKKIELEEEESQSSGEYNNGELPEYKNGKSSIHINPANRGKFNATKKRTGKTTEELAHSKNPLTRKRAIFALNARKWKH